MGGRIWFQCYSDGARGNLDILYNHRVGEATVKGIAKFDFCPARSFYQSIIEQEMERTICSQ